MIKVSNFIQTPFVNLAQARAGGVMTEGCLGQLAIANAPQHIITGTVCAGLVALFLFIIASTLRGGHRRAEFAQLRRDVRQLSEDVTALLAAEQRRLYKQINLPGDEAEAPSIAASGLSDSDNLTNDSKADAIVFDGPGRREAEAEFKSGARRNLERSRRV
jgi:hypothetical protein